MADVEEPQFTTLAERIAALNKQKNFQAPPPGAGKRAPPPPPANRPRPASQVNGGALAERPSNGISVRPPPQLEATSPSLPPRPSKASTAEDAPPSLPRRTTAAPVEAQKTPPLPSRPDRPDRPDRILPPPLPGRSPSQQVSPGLPSRRTSAQTLALPAPTARRNSNASELSLVSTVSSLSLNQTSTASTASSDQPMRRLPPTLDQAKLPPLPPSRRELEARAKEAAEKEAAEAVRARLTTVKSAPIVPRIEAARPSLPPRLPTRPAKGPSAAEEVDEAPPPLPRRLPPPPTEYVKPGTGANRRTDDDDAPPPPLPLTSRPTMAQIEAVVARSKSTPAGSCLMCRDFSGPDDLAAKYPRENLPRQDPVGYLAHVLCDPFPSATDKARAIFTWCHHNIAYDVEGFFGGNIERRDPAGTIFSGKAVCEGYARTYESIAARAGLDCVVVCGHGKGYGYAPLKKGDAVPPRKATGHAWNAVRIDDGEWKLLDACWGAGAVEPGKYHKHFTPRMFTMSNEDFGDRHYPEDGRYFFRADGRRPSWEEYIVGAVRGGEKATCYSNIAAEGLSEYNFSPMERHIPVQGGEDVVRFQFAKVCEHWTPERNGKGPGKQRLFMMKIHGRDGRRDDLVPLEGDGFWFWADIPARDLGAPGQKIYMYGLDTLDGRDAHGVTKQQFLAKKGRCGMSWVGVAEWELV